MTTTTSRQEQSHTDSVFVKSNLNLLWLSTNFDHLSPDQMMTSFVQTTETGYNCSY